MTDDRRYVSPQELARRWSVEDRTIRKWVEAGVLPAHRLGQKLWRIDAQDAREFEQRELCGISGITASTT